jgi:hypothetical protein
VYGSLAAGAIGGTLAGFAEGSAPPRPTPTSGCGLELLDVLTEPGHGERVARGRGRRVAPSRR